MKIIESNIAGKYGDFSKCEDAIAVTEDFIAVIDGASSKSDRRYNGKSTGKIASELVKAAVAAVPFGADAETCMFMLNRAIFDWYEGEGLIDEVTVNPQYRPTAAIAVYSRHRREVWVLGDCQARFGGKSYTFPLKVDELYTDLRLRMLDYLLSIGMTADELLKDDISLNALKPIMARQPFVQNGLARNPFSYSILDGFGIRGGDIAVLKIEADTEEVCLATDGYPKLFGTLGESEDYLARIIAEDPLCRSEFKCFKGVYEGQNSFDDRAFVRFKTI